VVGSEGAFDELIAFRAFILSGWCDHGRSVQKAHSRRVETRFHPASTLVATLSCPSTLHLSFVLPQLRSEPLAQSGLSISEISKDSHGIDTWWRSQGSHPGLRP
jgi:hypothetical protein